MDETCSMDDLYMMIYMSKIAQKKWRTLEKRQVHL
jgi:hypothetical protein